MHVSPGGVTGMLAGSCRTFWVGRCGIRLRAGGQKVSALLGRHKLRSCSFVLQTWKNRGVGYGILPATSSPVRWSPGGIWWDGEVKGKVCSGSWSIGAPRKASASSPTAHQQRAHPWGAEGVCVPLGRLLQGAEALQSPVHAGGPHAQTYGREATQMHGEIPTSQAQGPSLNWGSPPKQRPVMTFHEP